MGKPSNSSTKEQRKSARKALLSNAIFISLNVTSKLASTIDLSEEGVSLNLTSPLKIGQVCAITFDVPIGDATQRALISGKVASCIEKGPEEFRVGIHFGQVDQTSKELIHLALDKHLKVSV
ncbi:MAG: PilZ domain-containing protein [Burkholderiales bacterium]|nr:PilZ domain-containing protein [Burkholderiales bacterium]